MVMARLHIICGNCGCNDMFEWDYNPQADDLGDGTFRGGVRISCKNCSTIHDLSNNAKLRAELERRAADVSAMARVLSDRAADACNIDRGDNWAMYGQEYIDDVQAMLAAAPSAPKADDPVKVQLLEALEAAEKKLCIAEYHLDKGEDDSVVFESEILIARAAIAAARKGEGE